MYPGRMQKKNTAEKKNFAVFFFSF